MCEDHLKPFDHYRPSFISNNFQGLATIGYHLLYYSISLGIVQATAIEMIRGYSVLKVSNRIQICLDVLTFVLYSNTMQDQMPTTIYEVIETTADLVGIRLIYATFVRDLAETVMHKAFKASNFEKDFVVVNRNSLDIVSYCFTEATKAKRDKCQG